MKRAVDQDLYYKMEEQGKHIFLNEFLYRYRIHENSISQNENIFKADYWHFYAKLKAYKRRNEKNGDIDNLTEKEIRLLASNYYIGRLERLKFVKNKSCEKIYFIWLAIKVFPFHKFKLKLKSLILVLFGRI